MAEERKRDSGMEIFGAAILLLLLALLCHFHVICPLPECPEGLFSCSNCLGSCCLPDGSCPCPEGSAPCSLYCPQTSNCPSGCCNINTCNCSAIPECPPHTSWSEARDCCVYTEGSFINQCAMLCSIDPLRIGGCTKGLDACDSTGCCPFGSIGWNDTQKCCVNEKGVCITSCLLNTSLSACTLPFVGGCDSTGCCPPDTYWNDSCCVTPSGFCYGDACANIICPDGQVCQDGVCIEDLCINVTCPTGFVCKDGLCINLCEGVVCPDGQVCLNGQCELDPCADMVCSSGQICIAGQCENDPCADVVCTGNLSCVGGACIDLCEGMNCPVGQKCLNGNCVDQCFDVTCPLGQICTNGNCVDPCEGVNCVSGQQCLNGHCVPSNLVDCQYTGTVGACADEIICSDGCVNEIKCVDLRLPEGQCIGIAGSCNTSSDCCCGYSCQNISGSGVCCPGGLWTCYTQ